MNIQATHSPNRRHSEEQGESRFATPHGSSSRKGAKQPKPMDHLIDRPDCSKLVGTFNLFIPRCSQTGRAPKADFKPLFLFNFVGVAGFEPAISGSQNRRGRPGSSIHRCAPLPHGAFDGKISQRGLTLPTSTIRPLVHGAHSLHASSRILPGVAATNAGNYDTL